MTLKEIKEFAIANKACMPQLNKFIEFIDNGDELSALPIVTGKHINL